MNKKTIRQKLPRILLVTALFTVLVFTFTSCASTGIEKIPLSEWSGVSESTSGSNDTEAETESESSSETESGETAEDSSSETSETGSEIAPEDDTSGSGKKDVTIKADHNFIDKLLSWIGVFLHWITMVMPANSYILTLLVFAVILEIVMLPFAIKQQKNSIKQARLRPKEMAIRRRYAGRNDQATQQKVTQEIQALYQKENYNPFGGCLPLLIQLPIVMVLYWLVIDPVKYVFSLSSNFTSFMYSYLSNAGVTFKAQSGSIEVLDKVRDLYTQTPEIFNNVGNYCANPDAVMDQVRLIASEEQYLNFNIGSVNFGEIPGLSPSSPIQWWLLVVPVLTFVVYFFSMKINRKLSFQPTQSVDDRQQACSNNMMDVTMPLMSVWMTTIVPGAVGIYWIFKSILGVVKQFIMSRAMPLPQLTEEDIKAAEKELYGKQQPKKIVKSENAGKVRSLHHIDDEDYDEKGNYNPKLSESVTKENTEEQKEEKLAENNMTEGAALKDESDKRKKGWKYNQNPEDDKKD